ncbi:hypothetical protein K1719_005871 [Acacia pycnantha]|nr:hypothetical protein K1719_005871 [Acacia pycnantha]
MNNTDSLSLTWWPKIKKQPKTPPYSARIRGQVFKIRGPDSIRFWQSSFSHAIPALSTEDRRSEVQKVVRGWSAWFAAVVRWSESLNMFQIRAKAENKDRRWFLDGGSRLFFDLQKIHRFQISSPLTLMDSVLHLYDVVNTPGVTTDISHMDTGAVVKSGYSDNDGRESRNHVGPLKKVPSYPYRDQNPGGVRFMCSYCGHISKRPVLDLLVPPGLGISNSNIVKEFVGEWQLG